MKPKKYREILKKIQKHNNWDEDLMSDAVNFFYSRVRKAMSSLEDTTMFIPKLGTFKIRKHRMDKMIAEKEELIKKLNPHEFTKYDSYRKNKEDLEKLYKIKNKFNELDKKRTEFRTGTRTKD